MNSAINYGGDPSKIIVGALKAITDPKAAAFEMPIELVDILEATDVPIHLHDFDQRLIEARDSAAYNLDVFNCLSVSAISTLGIYAAAVGFWLRQLSVRYDGEHSADFVAQVFEVYRELRGDLNDMIKLKEAAENARTIADDDFYFTEPDEPTLFIDRFRASLALLCDNTIPPKRLCRAWLSQDEDESSEQLQAWAANHSKLNWAMGIGIIEAALTLAENPVEGVDHQTKTEYLAETQDNSCD